MEEGFVNYSFGKDMENSWQRQSGGSGWQSLPAQQQNQISSGNVHLHSTSRGKSASHYLNVVSEAVNHWNPSLNSTQMGVPGSSFLSLLSGEVATGKAHAHSSGGAAASEVSRLSSVPFSGNVGAGGRVSVDQGCTSVPIFNNQGLHGDLQPLDTPKTDTSSELYSSQTLINFSDPRVGYLCGANASNVQKSHVENTFRVPHGVPRKNDSSVSSLPSSVPTAGPRVFCLGLSGKLLCNSGLLGIICTCHGSHMSIAKFAEHSGSRNVNPGTAVHVDGGETIVHWRKEYFLKLGIRIPEDHIGWDWPLGPSVTAGSLQHCQTPPKLSTDPHFNKTSSVDKWNHMLPPKNPQTGENLNELCHREKPVSTREDTCSNLKDLNSSAKSNLKFVSDDHLKGCSRSVCSTMPSCFGPRTPYDLCTPLSSCKDPIYESGVPSHWQKLNTIGKDVATKRCAGSLVDDMTSSNFELRLGQPSQKNHAMASVRSAIAVSGTLPVIHGQPQKSVYLDQPLCIAGTSRLAEERIQPGYFAGIVPSSSVRTEMSGLNDPRLIQGACRAPNASQLKTVQQGASCSNAAASGPFTNIRNPYEEKSCFELSNGAIKVSHGISMLHFGPSLVNSGQSGFSFLQEKMTDSKICADMLDSQKHQKVEEVRRSTRHGVHGTSEKNLGTHTKTSKILSFCGTTCNSNSGGNARDSGHTSCSAAREASNIWQFSDLRTSAPDPSSTLKYYGQASYPLHNGPIPSSFETFGSPLELGTVLASQTFPPGNGATNSISGNSFVASTRNSNTGTRQYFPGGSSKMYAFHSMPPLPNGILAAGTSKTTPVEEESQNCYVKRQTAPLQKNCCNFTNVQSAPEVATRSQVPANRENEKFTSVTDKWRNFPEPVVSQGCNSQGKNVEPQCHIHSDLEQARQLFKRFVNNANATTVQAGTCLSHGYFLNKSNFSRQSDCISGRHDCLGKFAAGELRDGDGKAVDSLEPLNGPILSEVYKFTEEGDSFAAKSVEHDMKKAEFNTFEWRDVPRKVGKGVNKSDTKVHEKTDYHAQRELEMSTHSSGCSAPAVTQLSIEANKKDSSSVDGNVKDILVVDEGSRIERCGSSDGNSGRSADFNGIPSKFNLMAKCSSKASVNKPFYGLKDDLWFRDYPNFRNFPGQSSTGFSVQPNNNQWQNFESESLRGKVNCKRLDLSVSAANKKAVKSGVDATDHIPDAKNKRILSQYDQQSFTGPRSVLENVKRVSRLPSGASRKRGLNLGIQVERTDAEAIFNDQNDFAGASEDIQRKRMRLVGSAEGLELEKSSNGIVSEITAGYAAVEYITVSGKLGGFRGRRPIVSGKYGVISSEVAINPAKIVSLRTIMKRAKRCSSNETEKVDPVILKESKKANFNTKREAKNRVSCMVSAELNSLQPTEGSEESDFSGSEDSSDRSHASNKRRRGWRKRHAILDSEIDYGSRRKFKKIRTRSLSELAVKGDDSTSLKPANLKDGVSTRSKSRFLSKANDSKMHTDEECIANKHSKEYSYRKGKDLESSCCVCGTSDTDDCNCLLQCTTCLIKVHQACYGISIVPKAPWYCRPCKTHSKNIVCVLCGYGGGAMTRAQRTCDVVKSLLRVWGIATESNLKNYEYSEPVGSSYQMLPSTKPIGESDPHLFIQPTQIESSSVDQRETDLSGHVGALDLPSSAPDSVSSNSIIAGVDDPTVKQWVHMVCGLWTPTTRCPNVDTMSAFDVSGAFQTNPDVVCSICQRPGGTCIQCRVDYCDVQFHPWCAHEKGLLQSEVEGVDKQSVGFYGRCMVHEMRQQVDPGSNDVSCAGHVERASTCARTEGYKGRKRDGFYVNSGQNGGGCLVSQEQLDAWTYINGLKSRTRGPAKLSTSVVEYDCRKEYARYKQSRGWKHLVVYKSGIHGLGLYTSQFIPRGGMVVEYVGEIVGGHVADKREAEYQAGKKLQYKSACYFFRIDKEHIIDATRKGGIARFVNHSCKPNCVAKVISVRTEKKVIFLAERDMYPGEEVTYDYHFNHEDEGKKLPCYCKAKNCRRYLN